MSKPGALRKGAQSGTSDEPVNILGTPQSVPLPEGCLPPLMQRWVDEVNHAMHLDKGGLAVALFSVISMIANAEHKIEVVEGFYGRPLIWANLIGVPSAKKTPVMKQAMKIVEMLERELDFERNQEVAQRIQELKDEGENEKDAAKIANQEIPPARILMANDATTEALMQIMAEPQQIDAGIGMYRDELVGLVNSMNAYRGGKGGDRQLFLEMHGGGPQRKSRVTKGSSVNVQNAALSIVGAMQPERLQEMCDKGVDDGWMQRFLYVVLPKQDFQPFVRDRHAATNLLMKDVMRGIMRQKPQTHVMDDEAFDEFNAFNAKYAPFRDRPEAIAHWYGKIGGHWLTLALLIHIFEGTKSTIVSGATAKAATRLLEEFLIPSAEVAFEIMDGRQNKVVDAAAHALLRHSSEGNHSITARDLKQNVNQLKKVTTQEIESLMSILESAGWCRRAGDQRKKAWIITPNLHKTFDRQLEAHIELTREIQERIMRA